MEQVHTAIDTMALRGAIYAKFSSQKAFAKALGWHQNKLSKIMNGAYVPNIDEAGMIRCGLDLPNELFVAIFFSQHNHQTVTKRREVV